MSIQNLTLQEISVAIVFVGGLIAGVKYLKKELEDCLKEFLERLLNKQFEDVNDKLDAMQGSIRTLDVQATKNFLVRYLADIEREDVIFDTEKQRFWEEYDHYINDLKENSYIKEWVARLKEEGKLKR